MPKIEHYVMRGRRISFVKGRANVSSTVIGALQGPRLGQGDFVDCMRSGLAWETVVGHTG